LKLSSGIVQILKTIFIPDEFFEALNAACLAARLAAAAAATLLWQQFDNVMQIS